MDKKKVTWIILALVLVAAIVGAAVVYNTLGGGNGKNTLSTPTEEGGESKNTVPAPDFTMLDYSGRTVKLSDYFGKPIVLNMWASWCPPCKAELPDFEQSFKTRDDIQFVILNLTDNTSETVDSAKKYIEGEGFTFPVFFDINQEAAYGYGASSIPMTFFIDKNGNVVTHAVGMIDAGTLARGIDLID